MGLSDRLSQEYVVSAIAYGRALAYADSTVEMRRRGPDITRATM
jgi:hypothetical protein